MAEPSDERRIFARFNADFPGRGLVSNNGAGEFLVGGKIENISEGGALLNYIVPLNLDSTPLEERIVSGKKIRLNFFPSYMEIEVTGQVEWFKRSSLNCSCGISFDTSGMENVGRLIENTGSDLF